MADFIPGQDGVESFRRAEIDERQGRKAIIDRLWGQTAQRAIDKGFGKSVPPADSVYAYPSTNGTVPLLVDGVNQLYKEVAALKARPFA